MPTFTEEKKYLNFNFLTNFQLFPEPLPVRAFVVRTSWTVNGYHMQSNVQ